MDSQSVLIARGLSMNSRDELFGHIGADLLARGYVRESYAQALKDREIAYPTGLQVSGGVAIPHTDASHVLKDALVVTTFDQPIEFGEMGGGPEDTVAASLAFFLVLADGKRHVKFLSTLIKAIQDTEFTSAISTIEDDDVASTVARKLNL